MKRLTALALALVMLLCLAGCADTQQNGELLQDKLNTNQVPQAPAKTDTQDTTQTSTSGKFPSSTTSDSY